MTRIRADFNSVDAEGFVRSRTSRADAELVQGDLVIVFDHEGHEAKGHVVSVDDRGRVKLAVDPATFHGADACRVRFTYASVGRVVDQHLISNLPTSPTSSSWQASERQTHYALQ